MTSSFIPDTFPTAPIHGTSRFARPRSPLFRNGIHLFGSTTALQPVPGLNLPNLSIFEDERLMDGFDDTPPHLFFPPALQVCDLSGDDCCALATLALGKGPFSVGKPAREVDINHF
ncbi:unnamed protein product, partial [Pylaiella littoralis]